MSALLLEGIGKRFGAVQALADVDLAVPAGSRTAIVGPSGCGKTTLLRIVAGFDVPDRGRVILDGRVLADGARAVPAHLRVIGYVPQDGALFPHLTVADNIGFALPRDAPGRMLRVHELARLCALDPSMLRRWPHELSGGQQQRVALARALAHRPSLMLLDEPFSALDTGLRAATRNAVAQLLSGAGITAILVTHDQAEALSFADQLAVMRDGRLVQAGKPLDVYYRPRDAATAAFLGEAIILPARVDRGVATCALGRMPVTDASYSGAAQIMLRPEQLQLGATTVPFGAHGADAAHAAYTAHAAHAAHAAAAAAMPGGDGRGVVTSVEFDGPTCRVALRVASMVADEGDITVHVRCLSAMAPQPGSRVHVTIAGHAHVLDAAANERPGYSVKLSDRSSTPGSVMLES
jgi:iron(III) transport system ATP-binding protein